MLINISVAILPTTCPPSICFGFEPAVTNVGARPGLNDVCFQQTTAC